MMKKEKLAALTKKELIAKIAQLERSAPNDLISMWKLFFSSLDHAAFLFTPDHRILELNRKACSLLKVKSSDAKGKTCYSLMGSSREKCFCSVMKEQNKKNSDGFLSCAGRFCRVAQIKIKYKGENYIVQTIEDRTREEKIQNSLKLNLNRFQALTESSPVGVFEMDPQGLCVYSNETLKNMTGFLNNKLLGRGWVKAIHPEDQARVVESHNKALKSKKSLVIEFRLSQKNSSTLWVSASERPVFYENGTYAGHIGNVTDVSHVRTMVETLKYSRALYSTIIDHIPFPMYVSDLDFTVLLCNRAMVRHAEFWGIKSLLGEKLPDSLPGDLIDKMPESVCLKKMVIQTGKPANIELQSVRNGKTYYFKVYYIPITAGEKVAQIITLIYNHTKEQELQNDLISSREEFQSLFWNSPDAIFLTDPEGKFRDCNPAALNYFFYIYGTRNRKKLLGMDLMSFFIDQNREEAVKLVKILRDTGQVKGFEHTLKLQNGSSIFIELSGSLLYDNRNKPVCFMGIIRDRTEYRHMQEQILRSAGLAAVGQLSAGIAHEFNNVLSIIHGNAELGRMENSSIEDTRESLEIILNQTARGGKIVKDILSFARPEKLNLETFSFPDLIQETCKILKKQFQYEGISLNCTCGKSIEYLGDRRQIQQMLLNLLINSRDAVREVQEGCISVHCIQQNDHISLVIKDNGTGMDEKTLQKIFNPFFTTKLGIQMSEPNVQGVGLGLSISLQIIELHNGIINVESKPGKGTEFFIRFPLLPLRKIKKQTTRPDKTDRKTVNLSGKNFLVIDDETELRNVLQNILFKKGAGSVRVCVSGGDALKLHSSDKPDYVFMDYIMPGLTGYKLAEALKRLWPSARIILMSGKLEIIEDRKLLVNTYAFLQKPFSMQDIDYIFQKGEIKV